MRVHGLPGTVSLNFQSTNASLLISLLWASLFSPPFTSHICWLVVQTQSMTELWVKCASVLPLAVRDPPQPAPGPDASSRRKETPECLHACGHISPQP